jgi:hypothetical protein
MGLGGFARVEDLQLGEAKVVLHDCTDWKVEKLDIVHVHKGKGEGYDFMVFGLKFFFSEIPTFQLSDINLMLEEYHMIFPVLYSDDIRNLVFVLEVDKNIIIDVGCFGADG